MEIVNGNAKLVLDPKYPPPPKPDHGFYLIKPPRAGRLHALIEQYLHECSKQTTSGTTAKYRYSLESFLAFIGDKSMTRDLVQGWVDGLIAGGNLPSTVAFRLKHLRAFVRWLAANNRCDTNLTLNIRHPPVNFNKARANRLTEAEYLLLMEKLQAANNVHVAYLITMGYRAGMRLSDACLLLRSDVDMERCCADYTPHKTRRLATRGKVVWRNDPTCPTYDVYRALKFFMDMPPRRVFEAEYVVPHLANQYLRNPGTPTMLVAYAFQRYGLAHRSSHSCRRGFCSNVANHSNLNAAAASKLTGQSVATFRSYVTLDNEAVTAAVSEAFTKVRDKALCQPTDRNTLILALKNPGAVNPRPSEDDLVLNPS